MIRRIVCEVSETEIGDSETKARESEREAVRSETRDSESGAGVVGLKNGDGELDDKIMTSKTEAE